MTRINLVPVEELSDQHLLAEYRELPRMASFTEKTVKRVSDIPSVYTLNTGHMTFFLNKAPFLEQRHQDIIEELKRRGTNLTTKEPFKMPLRFPQVQWTPSESEVQISRNRILEKLRLKPLFYTWFKALRTKV